MQGLNDVIILQETLVSKVREKKITKGWRISKLQIFDLVFVVFS